MQQLPSGACLAAIGAPSGIQAIEVQWGKLTHRQRKRDQTDLYDSTMPVMQRTPDGQIKTHIARDMRQKRKEPARFNPANLVPHDRRQKATHSHQQTAGCGAISLVYCSLPLGTLLKSYFQYNLETVNFTIYLYLLAFVCVLVFTRLACLTHKLKDSTH